MSKIIYKVAPPGEGKTKWLVNKAYEELAAGKRCLYVSTDDSSHDYEHFCKMYLYEFLQICPVMPYSIDSLDSDCVILIDDAMKCNYIGRIVNFVEETGCTVYITVNGYLENSSEQKECTKQEFEQLTIFDAINYAEGR